MASEKIVTPVKTGVQPFRTARRLWIPAFAGMTGYRDIGLLQEHHIHAPRKHP